MKKLEKSMRSGYSIFWTDEANSNYDSIVNYLEKNWSDKEKSAFVKKLEKRVELIKQYPEIFPASQLSKKAYRSVLTNQITIYYSIENQIIKILALFDVRQNSEKLKIQ